MDNKRYAEMDAGAQAERLLSDPIMVSVRESLEQTLITRWQTERDAGVRDEIWRELQALCRIWDQIQDMVNTGRMADKQVNDG